MSVAAFGNHSAVTVPRQDRDSIRKFYCDAIARLVLPATNGSGRLHNSGIGSIPRYQVGAPLRHVRHDINVIKSSCRGRSGRATANSQTHQNIVGHLDRLSSDQRPIGPVRRIRVYTRHAAIRPNKPTPSAGQFPFSVLAVAIS
jgi:hypothetical protein